MMTTSVNSRALRTVGDLFWLINSRKFQQMYLFVHSGWVVFPRRDAGRPFQNGWEPIWRWSPAARVAIKNVPSLERSCRETGNVTSALRPHTGAAAVVTGDDWRLDGAPTRPPVGQGVDVTDWLEPVCGAVQKHLIIFSPSILILVRFLRNSMPLQTFWAVIKGVDFKTPPWTGVAVPVGALFLLLACV